MSDVSKKSRAKAKAKRFGEGSAKPMVSASTFGAGAFALDQQPGDTYRVTSSKRELLVVDGYNIIHATPRYSQRSTTIPTT